MIAGFSVSTQGQIREDDLLSINLNEALVFLTTDIEKGAFWAEGGKPCPKGEAAGHGFPRVLAARRLACIVSRYPREPRKPKKAVRSRGKRRR